MALCWALWKYLGKLNVWNTVYHKKLTCILLLYHNRVTFCSSFERSCIRKETGRKAPLKAYPLLTLCLLSSSALSTLSLNYINFPTKVVFRSCKLLPTMLFSTCINKRKYSSLEYVSAVLVCAGLVLFTSADWRSVR